MFTAPELLQETDRCVVCGLCLPRCPTYLLSLDEGESPRGRINLVQGLLSGRLEEDAAAWGHIDRCLGCGACEAMCPSKVRFGRIMDGARALRALPPGKGGAGWRFLRRLLSSGWGGRLLRLARRSGALAIARHSGLLHLLRLEGGAPPLPHLVSAPPLPRGEAAGVGLFVGCLGEGLEPEVLAATRRILERLGRRVTVPARQGCCGALDLHAGARPRAEALARANLVAFAGCERIISVASGCGAQLSEYGELLGAEGEGLAARHADIVMFLADQPLGAHLRPLAARIAVHEPCSLRNALKGSDALYRLLRQIPGAEVVALPGNEFCCGAAGEHMLREPKRAVVLREPKLRAVAELRPDLLVTTNIGCALHLRGGLPADGPELLHPVVLLDRLME